MENEIWKDIETSEGVYIVSNRGSVRNKRTKKTLKLHKTVWGYFAAPLWLKDHMKSCVIHRLVAIAFIPNPENKPQVNHINGQKSDNRVENLEWCTQSENLKHAYRTGLKSNAGEKHPKAKLNYQKVKRIRLMREITPKLPAREIARMFKVSEGTINFVLKGQTWKNIN